jgi:hypothetical protein
MNGRVCDPHLGRFLSADPIIQTIHLSQALNPFSYVMNNPLTLIDPSGYSWLSKGWKKLRHAVKKIFNGLKDSLNLLAAIAIAAVSIITQNYELLSVAAQIALSPVQISYSQGTGTGPPTPGGNPGSNVTPNIPGVALNSSGQRDHEQHRCFLRVNIRRY